MHFSELKQLRWVASGTVMRATERGRDCERGKMHTSEGRALSLFLSLCSVSAAVNKVSSTKRFRCTKFNSIRFSKVSNPSHDLVSSLAVHSLCLSLSCSITALANVKSTNAMRCGWLRCQRQRRHIYWGVGSWVKIIDTGEMRCRRTRLLLFLLLQPSGYKAAPLIRVSA